MPQMTFDPPRYEWHAQTAEEAKNILEAARDMIDAHINTLVPQGGADRVEARRVTPVPLLVSLDLSGAVARINDQRTLHSLDSDLSDLDTDGG